MRDEEERYAALSEAIKELARRDVVVRMAIDAYMSGVPYGTAMEAAVRVLAGRVEDQQKQIIKLTSCSPSVSVTLSAEDWAEMTGRGK